MDTQIPINSKLANVGTSIFAVMSKLANDYSAINLSQGFPDFNCDAELIELVHTNMNKGRNQYAPMQGVVELREILSTKIQNLYQAKYDPINEITITAGGTQAIFTAITAFITRGDEVIVIEPAYDCYVPAIRLNGGIPIFATLKYPKYQIDWTDLKLKVNNKTKMIIINTPHNPTGSLLTKEDLDALHNIVKDTNIVILSDEVYEHIIFDNNQHQSICLYPELYHRSLITFSFGKTLHTTGWKMGYVLAPEKITAEFRKTHQFNVFSCNTPIQYAIAEYYKNEEKYLYLSSFYQQKRDFFLNNIKNSRFKIIDCKGTYFQLLDYSAITDEKDTDFAVRMTKEIGVASIPLSVFYHNLTDDKVLRFCFAKSEETLLEAALRLCKI